MKLLVLGGGFVGRAVHDHLKEYHNVHLVTQKEVDYTLTQKYPDSQDFVQYLAGVQPRYDMVINCSGYTGKPNVDACEDNKEVCWLYNVTAPVRTAQVVNDYLKIPIIHVSSGCIYDGDNGFSETDVPNFGLYDAHSSFYSKSKHAGELALLNLDAYILRIRMPVCGFAHDKNLLCKLMKYERLLNKTNSITRIEDLAKLIEKVCEHHHDLPPGIYNAVNTGGLDHEMIVNMIRNHGLARQGWTYVDEEDLKLKCRRSNCTLSTDKLAKYKLSLPPARLAINQSIIGLKLDWDEKYGRLD